MNTPGNIDSTEIPETLEDPALEVISELRSALRDNIAEERELDRELHGLARGRRAGKAWSELLPPDDAPPALSLLGSVLRRITRFGGAFRRSLAVSLIAEGESVSSVARRFGVTRQRIFSLLRAAGAKGR